ncbi:hypothetical protein PV08_05867 [Exophiala spinifera]|uniref:AD domain-containing protein n=1 Tax=Exophiala spinifera TaxID=91928 RepID=A0A0D1ZSK2_9EURO|nr:uncharacterized protein PV08_05867 [Exophiala spinifera]KIW15817.1 hypothetical protein PV08_05867 [Exophiala spinifera]
MATDSKRQNAGAKVPVALPKGEPTQPAASPVPLDMALQQVIGSRIRVTTSAPNQASVEGIVYTADPLTSLLVLNTTSAPSNSTTSTSLAAPTGSYRFLPISQITGFQLLSLPQQPSELLNPAFNTIDTNAVQARLTRNISAQQAAQARLGPKGTTPTDQALFDALSRTHPARWVGNVMLISDTYLIEKPYTAATVKLSEGLHGDIDRMRKVVDMERSKVTLKLSKNLIDGKMAADNIGKVFTGGAKKGG